MLQCNFVFVWFRYHIQLDLINSFHLICNSIYLKNFRWHSPNHSPIWVSYFCLFGKCNWRTIEIKCHEAIFFTKIITCGDEWKLSLKVFNHFHPVFRNIWLNRFWGNPGSATGFSLEVLWEYQHTRLSSECKCRILFRPTLHHWSNVFIKLLKH